MSRKVAVAVLGVLLVLALRPLALAWGPHPKITTAALDSLGADDPLLKHLGIHGPRLSTYCWMGDYRRQLLTTKAEQYYADDFLLFPGMPKHLDHLCPAVRGTYAPHFKRALQALRTETPQNAARWIGSLLHFVEDTGSPPHAAEISGEVHSKMENWVDATKIVLGDYKPRLLGATDEEALDGFLKRMDGLIEFSKQRGLRCQPLVKLGERALVEPIVLESALETSRVVADLLYTLGQLGLQSGKSGAALRGRISSEGLPRLERVPAKIILEGTLYSTLADEDGRYEFRNLPAGRYTLHVLRAGHSLQQLSVELAAGENVTRDLTLEALAPRNLLRNGDFRLHWVQPDVPDAWYPQTPKTWQSEFIPVEAAKKYRLSLQWKENTRARVEIKFVASPTPGDAGKSQDIMTMTAGAAERILEWGDRSGFVQLFLHADEGSPEKHWSGVTLTLVE